MGTGFRHLALAFSRGCPSFGEPREHPSNNPLAGWPMRPVARRFMGRGLSARHACRLTRIVARLRFLAGGVFSVDQLQMGMAGPVFKVCPITFL